jgi:epoxyqueuosine reductase
MQRAEDFALSTLLTMDEKHYVDKVWPLAFYISRKKVAKWQMNAARALGNQGDPGNVPLLVQCLNDSPYEMVRGMCAWSLGQIGGARARAALEGRRSRENALVRLEIEKALEIK